VGWAVMAAAGGRAPPAASSAHQPHDLSKPPGGSASVGPVESHAAPHELESTRASSRETPSSNTGSGVSKLRIT
jgi:hypothetical protein